MLGALRKVLPLLNRHRSGMTLVTKEGLAVTKKRLASHSASAEADSLPGIFSSESILEFACWYLIVPTIIWSRIHSYYEMEREINEEPVLPPRYEYLGKINKPFPWGDGKTPLFGWPRGRSPEEYAARKAAGLPMPDLLDDLPEDDDEE